MKSSIAENIRKYRKENGMTQDALAERLGITLGTVSKWERGTSEPDIRNMMMLAEAFRISVDALLGFSLQGNDEDAAMSKMEACVGERDFQRALQECEAALLKFPNQFRIVYNAAKIHNLAGFVNGDRGLLEKAVSLYHHSLELFSQNTNPEINEIEINNQIAECYLRMKEYEKGVEELKRNNVCGINNADIGLYLIHALKRNDEGKKYTGHALLSNITQMITISSALVTYCMNKNDPRRSILACGWYIGYFRLLKVQTKKPAFVDKYISAYLMIESYNHALLGQHDEMVRTLNAAAKMAKEYDEKPVYDLSNIVFLMYEEHLNVFDDLGTAMDGLRTVVEEVWDRAPEEFKKEYREVMSKYETVKETA